MRVPETGGCGRRQSFKITITMSYQVLARKWRPHRFEDMVGQRHVLQALTNALDSDRLHHAYLFTGTRGVGKTTVARIFAKSLNCEEGVSANPCGRCATCLEIDEGRFVDLIEVDAASRTGVDDTRELLDNVQYAPARGRYKVYLIDEVHMFSKSSFNALLKTLEEPPPHIKFLLATTDPKKIPATILSRCLQFSLKRLTPDQIEAQLQHILSEEQITTDTRSLEMLATAADGSMRDALSLLDQAIAFGGGTLQADDVAGMLGTIDKDQVLDLLAILLEGNAANVLDKTAKMAESAPDYTIILTELLAQLQALAVLQMVPDARADHRDTPRLLELVKKISPEACQLYYQIALAGLRDLHFHPQPSAGFEMCLLRMLAFAPANAAMQSGAEKKKSLTRTHAESTPDTFTTSRDVLREASLASSAQPAESAELSDHDTSERQAANNPSLSSAPFARQPNPGPTERKQAIPSENSPSANAASPVTPGEEFSTSAASSAVDVEAFSARSASASKFTLSSLTSSAWPQLIQAMNLNGMVYQLAISCVFEAVDGLRFQLQMPTGTICTDGLRAQLEKSLQSYFEDSIRLDIRETDRTAAETPKAQMDREEAERLAHAQQVIESDPNIQLLREVFDATVLTDSITPLNHDQTGENP